MRPCCVKSVIVMSIFRAIFESFYSCFVFWGHFEALLCLFIALCVFLWSFYMKQDSQVPLLVQKLRLNFSI